MKTRTKMFSERGLKRVKVYTTFKILKKLTRCKTPSRSVSELRIDTKASLRLSDIVHNIR